MTIELYKFTFTIPYNIFTDNKAGTNRISPSMQAGTAQTWGYRTSCVCWATSGRQLHRQH